MGKHTPSGSWRHLMGKDSTSNTLQKGNSQQFPMTAPFHFQLKSLFKVYYQKLFMYSKYTPDVFMPWKTCVFMCVCVCKTHWLALKKKNQMSCQSRQLFDAFERSKYVFQLSKSAYDAQKKAIQRGCDHYLCFERHISPDIHMCGQPKWGFKPCPTSLNDVVFLGSSLGFETPTFLYVVHV